MLPSDVNVVSVDDHIIEPPHVWSSRLPQKYKERGPRFVEINASGDEGWVWEDRVYPFAQLGTKATRTGETPTDDIYVKRLTGLIPAAYEPQARVLAMDADGISKQLNFPSFPRFAGTRFLEADDWDLALAMVEAYNDWLLDEWGGTAPDRFISAIIVPLWNVELAVKEIERCAPKGAKTITFPENPSPLGLPSFSEKYWDPLFACAAAHQMPLSMHIGTSGDIPQPSKDSSEVVGISLCGVNSMMGCAELIFSGMLHRHPTSRIAYSEGGCGWVPYLLERMDYTWARTTFEVDRSLSPRELFDRHIWSCFISDDTGVLLREQIGVNKLMFESDFPHNDCNWPNSRGVIEEMLKDVEEDAARRIAETNACELYNL
jgi:predicted TIM-barrel fold metal-dependent hydrolase